MKELETIHCNESVYLASKSIDMIDAVEKGYEKGYIDGYLKAINKNILKVAKKLKEYEDLEEQGLLLRLPCKVGDTLYYPSGYFNIVIPIRLNEIIMSFVGLDTCSFQYNCCSFDECGDVYEEYEFGLNDFNKTVFLTQAEAEQKLKEMEEMCNE